jgi:hypothetical protein
MQILDVRKGEQEYLVPSIARKSKKAMWLVLDLAHDVHSACGCLTVNNQPVTGKCTSTLTFTVYMLKPWRPVNSRQQNVKLLGGYPSYCSWRDHRRFLFLESVHRFSCKVSSCPCELFENPFAVAIFHFLASQLRIFFSCTIHNLEWKWK